MGLLYFLFSPYDHVFLFPFEYMERARSIILTSFLFIPFVLPFVISGSALLSFFPPAYGSYFSPPRVIFDYVLAVQVYAIACSILLCVCVFFFSFVVFFKCWV